MKRIISILLIIFTVVLFTSCSNALSPVKAGVNVEKIDGLKSDFIMGADISSVIAEENSGVVYRNSDSAQQDIFLTLKQSGINYIRVRVWNDPFDKDKNSYGGGANDIDTAVKIAGRAAAQNLKLLVDFHCSDFFADPKKQQPPKAWANMTLTEKSESLYLYIRESLAKIADSGAEVGMVQIGNETNNFFCGETEWENIALLMNSGAKAVREANPDIKVVLHFANPEKADNYYYYAGQLEAYNVDYDVFASSYYPYWHGTTENLTEVLKNISDRYNKYVMVAETSFAYTYLDGDNFANTIGEGGSFDIRYDVSVQGQADGIRDVISAVHRIGDKGLGVFYWEPAWIPVPGRDYSERKILWEKYGSGWASSYAAEYDAYDAGKYFGGSAVDNQALFDYDGKPLDSLKTFSYVYSGAVK